MASKSKRDYESMTPIQVYSLVVKGKLKKFPNNYLDKDRVKEIVRFVILEQYKYTREDVISKVDHCFFQENFLGGARKMFSHNNDVSMLIYCFPE